jgi:hypothetical protein
MNYLNSLTKTQPLNTALLFIVFNRPNTTAVVFNEIRKARPTRLYIASDGPRTHLIDELKKINHVRKIVRDIDWKCEVRTLFSEKNLGCKEACSRAIDWFFEKEEEGIILEDDCLPHPDFFYFCEILLNHYKFEKKIFQITGCNFQNNINRGKASYYFSNYNHLWGWATWKRAWKYYNKEMKFWPEWKESDDWKKKFSDKVERNFWENNFEASYKNQIDTWCYPWQSSVWKNGGLTVTPNVNLISNIGFGVDATHTTNKKDINSNIPTKSIGKIVYTNVFEVNKKADLYTFNNHYEGKKMRFIWVLARKVFRFFFK